MTSTIHRKHATIYYPRCQCSCLFSRGIAMARVCMRTIPTIPTVSRLIPEHLFIRCSERIWMRNHFRDDLEKDENWAQSYYRSNNWKGDEGGVEISNHSNQIREHLGWPVRFATFDVFCCIEIDPGSLTFHNLSTVLGGSQRSILVSNPWLCSRKQLPVPVTCDFSRRAWQPYTL